MNNNLHDIGQVLDLLEDIQSGEISINDLKLTAAEAITKVRRVRNRIQAQKTATEKPKQPVAAH